MVGKLDTKNLDKIESVPDYRVQATLESRDEGGGKGQGQEEDEYSSSGSRSWQKYHTGDANRKALKFRTKDISKLFFNQVVLQRGLVVLDADLKLINGQVIKNAHIIFTKVDLYWQLKKNEKGSEIPVGEILKEDYVEVSIFSGVGSGSVKGPVKYTAAKDSWFSNSVVFRPQEWSLWPLYNNATGKFNWLAIVLYLVVGISLGIAFIMSL